MHARQVDGLVMHNSKASGHFLAHSYMANARISYTSGNAHAGYPVETGSYSDWPAAFAFQFYDTGACCLQPRYSCCLVAFDPPRCSGALNAEQHRTTKPRLLPRFYIFNARTHCAGTRTFLSNLTFEGYPWLPAMGGSRYARH